MYGRGPYGAIAVLSATSLTASVDARAQDDPIDPAELTATSLTSAERITGNKTLTSRLAESDPALLGRTDSTPVEVVVKLDYDSVATYQGPSTDLAATSPSVTGEELTGSTPAEQAYEGYIVDQENAFLDAVAAGGPRRARRSIVAQRVRRRCPHGAGERGRRTILAIPNVVAVQSDTLDQPLTDSSSEFIGADAVYPDLDGMSRAPAPGVTVGVLDTGSLAGAPVVRRPGQPRPRPGPARAVQLRRQPADAGVRPVRVQQQAARRSRLPHRPTSRRGPRPQPSRTSTARDSNGHGTHTASTAAGNVLDSAEVFGVERGPINGIAPGAYVIVYKVCGIQGCFDSDTAAAVDQAVLDGVNVINFSISGGTDPFTDPTELAFLDAYAAGVFVAASAGNDGPGAGTANHLSPWVTTVAASTQRASSIDAHADRGQRRHVHRDGASITAGAGPLPVVLPSAAPYNNDTPLLQRPGRRPATFTGKIVACQRGVQRPGREGLQRPPGRRRGHDPLQPGARRHRDRQPLAAHRPPRRRHGLRRLHERSHAGVTGSFTAGEPRDGQGDVMAAFSSRGPAGLFIKPDITAPGVQILAGHTPTPREPDPVDGAPARPVLPGDRRHLDVVAARRRLGGAGQGAASVLDAGPDQVGADDDGDHRRGQGGHRHAGRSVRLRRRPRRPRGRRAHRR